MENIKTIKRLFIFSKKKSCMCNNLKMGNFYNLMNNNILTHFKTTSIAEICAIA